MRYSARERSWFGILAVGSFAILNGTFVWAMLTRPDALGSALANPVAAAFISEAFVLMGVLAYLLGRWNVSSVHWSGFVLLSLLGGISFALPLVLLWSSRRSDGAAETARR
jgi:hypothetical protein